MLLGWYLMTRPAPPEKLSDWGSAAPLKDWDIFESFDTAAKCEARRSQIKTPADARIAKLDKPITSLSPRLRVDVRYSLALCVASDDPRLVR
jgi:hypothetical protein